MNEFVSETHDFRKLLLACVSQEVEQGLLQISRFGVTKLKQKNITQIKSYCLHCNT